MVLGLKERGPGLGAPRAISNLKTSWLSREIFFSAGFFVLWLVSYYVEVKAKASDGAKASLGWVAGLCGVIALISMANIYVYTILPAWETAYTHIVFYSTALVLGAILYAVLNYRARQENQEGMLKATIILAVIGILLQVVSLPPYLVALGAGPVAARATAALLLGAAPVLVLSQALAVIGGLVFTFLALRAYSGKGSALTGQWLYGALVLLVVAELASRYLFYATGVNIMVGQF
ncbi:DmsC/YnfH family molybdoenzyme membrane anchor subunit [Moorella naiadis]|uniref:dimethyl sulfoxide reductase anchor subunit family protein n=1 Tax=Moorella naiadis (nom. illeg.) TaxID=3093670 RepID=UPI003D9C8F96